MPITINSTQATILLAIGALFLVFLSAPACFFATMDNRKNAPKYLKTYSIIYIAIFIAIILYIVALTEQIAPPIFVIRD